MEGKANASDLLFALSHPLRRKILRMMAVDETDRLGPRGLADSLDEPLGNVSYHMSVLLERGAIELVGTGNRRGALAHYYRLTKPEPWALEILEEHLIILPEPGSSTAGNTRLLFVVRHPLRRRILRLMYGSSDPISPKEISRKLGEPLGTIGYHVRVCAEKGAIELVEEKPVRGASQHFYRVKADESWLLKIVGLDGRRHLGPAEGGSA